MRVVIQEALQDGVVLGEIVDGNGHHDASCGQNYPIRRHTVLESVPLDGKRGLIDVPVDPVAVLEIVIDERVDSTQ